MANNIGEIPAERKAYMLDAARAMGLREQLSPEELKIVLLESYQANPELRGMLLQADLEERAATFKANWDPDEAFWAKVGDLVGNQESQKLQDKYSELKQAQPQTRDFTELKRILKAIQLNQVLVVAELHGNFDDGSLEDSLYQIYKRKREENMQFGGKKKLHRKKSIRKSRKSTKTRKGKGRK